MKRSTIASLSLVTVLLSAAPARALMQPDGTVIPTGNGLQGLFTSRGEGISALADAAVVPETFIPTCALTFTVLQRNAGYKNSFGWYNVTGSKPSDAELHEFLTCNDGVGVVKTLDIKSDPGYTGGLIGFYQATGNCATIPNHIYIFFSEKQWNPDALQANPFYHLLIYNSTVTAKAFYFGWEDLLAGGDNDFDDLTTFVTGIACSGGGAACQTGKPGVCGDGTLQCQAGMLTCVQSNQPTAEECDGLDNDCDGTVDLGDICDAGYVCDKGSCVPVCNGGEFTCQPDEVCSPEGLCVDPACVMIDCPEGQKCVGGFCKGPCDGVVCPHGQVCRVGVCLDPCSAITCDAEQVCMAGACVEKCQCGGCTPTETCNADGTCTPAPCDGKVCNPGEYCAPDGTCADACAGAVCPDGQTCMQGQCVDIPAMSTGGTGGTTFVGAGGSNGGAGGAGGAHANGGAGGAKASGGAGDAGSAGGCGCRVGEGEDGQGLAAIAAAIALAAARRRRRDRRG